MVRIKLHRGGIIFSMLKPKPEVVFQNNVTVNKYKKIGLRRNILRCNALMVRGVFDAPIKPPPET